MPSLARQLRRVGHGAAPKLRRLWTRGLALVAARPRARAAQSGGGVTGVADGSTIGFNGELQAGDVTVFVEYRTNSGADGVEGARCPSGAGRLKGRRRGETSVTIRLVGRDRQLISSNSTTLKLNDTYEAQTADDAKLDTLTIDHEGVVASRVQTGGDRPMTVEITTSRHTPADFGGGTTR